MGTGGNNWKYNTSQYLKFASLHIQYLHHLSDDTESNWGKYKSSSKSPKLKIFIFTNYFYRARLILSYVDNSHLGNEILDNMISKQ